MINNKQTAARILEIFSNLSLPLVAGFCVTSVLGIIHNLG